ncbi:MAG: amidophosphoribosyltransferase [Parashewanella sp.]
MCGIVGIVGQSAVNQTIYDALTVLQHRGQDAAGIVTEDKGAFRLRKANGLVKEVFEAKHMQRLQGNAGIGHVRYPTAGSSSASEAQPFYVNSPFGISLAHNGNLINTGELLENLQLKRRHINTTSDSEILLNTLADELQQVSGLSLTPDEVFSAVKQVHRKASGAYAVVAMIIGQGLVAFRDPFGIRPLVLGKHETATGTEYMVASESVALDAVGFEVIRDVAPGEAIYIDLKGNLHTRQCSDNPQYAPCIFEYVYFARPDSTLDKASVYASRINMGTKLGEKIKREWGDEHDIDVVIPIPETSCDIALEIASSLDLPYRQGFVKNRYIGRTFIMPGQVERKKSVRRKLNAIGQEFKGKNVLLVDDSIVRGTTSEQIIEMAREAGAKKVYFASAAPEIRFPNVYGIDMPTSNELIAYGRDVDEIARIIGADGMIFQDLRDLVAAVQMENPDLQEFETSVFDGHYVTKNVNQAYLDHITQLRNDDAKAAKNQDVGTNLELHNVCHP